MHLNSPFTIIAKRVDKASAYYIEWVLNIIEVYFFSSAKPDITFHINLFAFGSIPVEGSSKNRIYGFPITAIAKDNFLLFPPDKVPDSLSLYNVRSSF
jgi:hypothetical protein